MHKNTQAILDLYEASAKTIPAALAGISESELNWRPAPDSRSIGEIVRHLIRVDLWFMDRMGINLTTKDPGKTSPENINAAFLTLNEEIKDILRQCQNDQELFRPSGKSDAKPHETLAEDIIHMAQHYLYHLAQIVYLRRAQDREWASPLHLWEKATYLFSDKLAAMKNLRG